MTKQELYFLSFDYGTTNIGIAIGQKITKTATPLAPIHAKNGTPNWIEIDNLLKEWKPSALVVGVPYKLDGKDLKITKLAKSFIEQLKKRYNLPVHPAEERLTTKSAREEIFSRGGYRALQNISVDSVAAKLILEEWLSITQLN